MQCTNSSVKTLTIKTYSRNANNVQMMSFIWCNNAFIMAEKIILKLFCMKPIIIKPSGLQKPKHLQITQQRCVWIPQRKVVENKVRPAIIPGLASWDNITVSHTAIYFQGTDSWSIRQKNYLHPYAQRVVSSKYLKLLLLASKFPDILNNSSGYYYQCNAPMHSVRTGATQDK